MSTAAWLQRQGIASFDVVSFAISPKLFATSSRNLASLNAAPEISVRLKLGVRPFLPGSVAVNRMLVARLLRGKRYDFIQARTDYAAAVAGPLARRRGLPLVWDCRGDSEAEFRYRATQKGWPRPITEARSRALVALSEKAAEFSNAAIFVTEALRQRRASRLGGQPAAVIPCIVDTDRFYFDPELRARTRRQLGFGEEETVFVYSGSLGPYQGFDNALQFYKDLEGAHPRRLLILTPEVDVASALVEQAQVPGARVLCASFEEMNAYLNAADVAVMLRPRAALNDVAFPTKFAEFGAAGLGVVLNDSLPACMDAARAGGNLLDPKGPVEEPRSINQKMKIASFYRGHYSHSAFAESYRAIYESLFECHNLSSHPENSTPAAAR
ncbi:MAG TPA: glycosyltransferase [Methyloceanibacter sp.]|nr:glycosyltransferase [Methyloceanibacter sp.]